MLGSLAGDVHYLHYSLFLLFTYNLLMFPNYVFFFLKGLELTKLVDLKGLTLQSICWTWKHSNFTFTVHCDKNNTFYAYKGDQVALLSNMLTICIKSREQYISAYDNCCHILINLELIFKKTLVVLWFFILPTAIFFFFFIWKLNLINV